MVKYPLISLITNVGADGVVDVSEVPRLECNHPDADTRIFLHAFYANSTCQQPGDIVVRATDTDISVIRIHYSHGGKKRPLKIAEENYSFLDAFAALATGQVDRATCEALEEYTSKLVIETKGPTNTRVYIVAVYFRGKRLAKGSGHSIQQAEMDAASNALIACKGRI
ncbi:Ribonuclease 3 [Nymphon striatum]|nr:Ribonuclease 3 [Nymphon striatum]